MRLLQKTKDGGRESTVDAYFLCEFKGLFSIALLRFNNGSRTNYHSHAFHALTWFLGGDMREERLQAGGSVTIRKYRRSLLPKFTSRSNFHKVVANKPSWAFTIRGPWVDTWWEYNPKDSNYIKLTHGRNVQATQKKQPVL